MFRRLLTRARLYLAGPKFAAAAKRAVRTFGYAFAAVLVPGLLGWFHAVTEWAQGQGATPFPDAHGLAYVAVSAIVAGGIAVLNLIGIVVEDAAGKPVLRRPGA